MLRCEQGYGGQYGEMALFGKAESEGRAMLRDAVLKYAQAQMAKLYPA